MAKEALDAVKDAEQKAAGILDTAAARCAAIRQDAAQKADKLKTERMQKAKADLAAAKQSAAKQRERNPRYPRGHHRLTRRQHERRGSPYGGNAYEAHQHLCAQEPS